MFREAYSFLLLTSLLGADCSARPLLARIRDQLEAPAAHCDHVAVACTSRDGVQLATQVADRLVHRVVLNAAVRRIPPNRLDNVVGGAEAIDMLAQIAQQAVFLLGQMCVRHRAPIDAELVTVWHVLDSERPVENRLGDGSDQRQGIGLGAAVLFPEHLDQQLLVAGHQNLIAVTQKLGDAWPELKSIQPGAVEAAQVGNGIAFSIDVSNLKVAPRDDARLLALEEARQTQITGLRQPSDYLVVSMHLEARVALRKVEGQCSHHMTHSTGSPHQWQPHLVEARIPDRVAQGHPGLAIVEPSHPCAGVENDHR